MKNWITFICLIIFTNESSFRDTRQRPYNIKKKASRKNEFGENVSTFDNTHQTCDVTNSLTQTANVLAAEACKIYQSFFKK